MSNIKKVQTEADRLLKKVNEGLDAYDELHEKLANAPNASAKERLEGDLKRELKKLQRHREAMKSFMQNDDYKEKTKMQVSRKKIEERMETFRAIEREMKTKAFSNEGLASAALERADSATEQWLKDAIEEGRKKIELLEYEVQKANNGRVRRGKQQQKSEYQIRLENLQTHFFKWESLLRMVNNEELDTDEVDDLQEPIQKVLEDDVDLEVMEDMSIYDSFDIPEPKAKPVVPFDVSDYEDKKVQSPKTTAKAKTPTSTVQAKPSPFITSPKETAASSTPVPSSTQQPALAQTPQQLLPPTASSPADDDIGEEEPVPEWMDDDMDTANDDTFGDDAMSGGFTIGSLAEMASATSKVTQDWEKSQKPIGSPEPKTVKVTDSGHGAPEEKPKPTPPAAAPTPNAWERRAAEQQSRQKAQQQQQQKQAPDAASPVAPFGPVAATAEASAPEAVTTSLIAPAAAKSPSTPVGSVDTDPSQPFPPIPGAAPGSKFTPKKIHELLDMSLGNLPHTLDVQRQRPYEPPNAIDAIPYFPQEVLPVLSNKDVYHQMDLDTLFFIFYYHQKSYQQYFAAKELKARSYRYHTKQQRWYQRLERPQTTTETEERGSYTFFDFEDKWDHDRIDDFLFEYKYLENELH
ncbi:Not1 N-terminal domain, CCR4-Not complex component/NOT2 / NOT3 / NOT5 family, putative [Leishmania donovani]|uniref:Not1 N-terminal domain, CCR4-Not complex component/NOT2 / NOT3 / NOT5 family, putative n=1 Tax=Leishmania donovani TaxID=5661 RepID=A0A3S5H7F0_LEIDO|nr:Not1 N-terminal domain, CCR4-Not complex component/NOT2 / NOT3 / NOT5 family, putative [Leishmania donovani]